MKATSQSKRTAGFSLVELMVTVAIVAVIAAFAIPSYRAYTLKAHRVDAMRGIAAERQTLERCYSQNFTYIGCSVTVAGVAAPVCTALATSPNGYYTMSCTNLTASTYTVNAAATGAQAQDTNCTTFSTQQNGAQAASNSGGGNTTLTCWGSN